MKILILVGILLSESLAFADCTATKWPYSDLPKKSTELVSILRKMPRQNILSYYLYEIERLGSANAERLNFVRGLNFYLLNTAAGIKSQALIEMIAQVSDLSSNRLHAIELKKVCEFKKQIESIHETDE